MKTRLLVSLHYDFSWADANRRVSPLVSLDISDTCDKLSLRLHKADITKLEKLEITAVPREGYHVEYVAWEDLVKRRFMGSTPYSLKLAPKVVHQLYCRSLEEIFKRINAGHNPVVSPPIGTRELL